MRSFDLNAPASAARPSPGTVTALLRRVSDGDREAADELLPVVFGALHARAVRMLAGRGHSPHWQPTAVVDDAFLRLVGQRAVDWRDRRHFQAIAARVMRRIVADWARFATRARRDARRNQPLPTECIDGGLTAAQLAELDDLLDRLATVHARSQQVIELRFFGGLTMPDIAVQLGVSLRTVEGDWQFARAWLHARLNA